MIVVDNHTSISLDKIYKTYVSVYENELGYEVLLKHIGAFSSNLIQSFALGVEEMMKKLGDKPHVIKRMFSILIEGLQNMMLHGRMDENAQQTAFVIISKNDSSYRILFGNIIDKEDRSTVKTYLGNINNHSGEELRQLYLSILRNGYLKKQHGTGLGMITMRIKSSGPIHYQLYDLPDDKSFLVMEVELER